jgi:hypothetical protein
MREIGVKGGFIFIIVGLVNSASETCATRLWIQIKNRNGSVAGWANCGYFVILADITTRTASFGYRDFRYGHNSLSCLEIV